jgi:hypothetical protein
MKRLIYLKNGQSLDLLVSSLKLSSHDFADHVAHGFKTKKKMSNNSKSIKMTFFKTILIQLPTLLNTLLYT